LGRITVPNRTMGIPKYHKWLTDRYPKAFSQHRGQMPDHLYVDVNAHLHDAMRHARSEADFFNMLFSKFDSLFRQVAPKQTAFLAVDGPASCAKCLTQRSRRRAHLHKDQKDRKGAKGKGKHCAAQQTGLSNNMLTPGVPFMCKLTEALEYYAATRMAPGKPFAQCSSVTVSGANAIGEGEHKIVSQMLRHAAAGGAKDLHIILSGDADVFLLSLVQSSVRRVCVVSERAAEGAKRSRGPVLEFWDAEALARYLHKELKLAPGTMGVGAGEAAIRRDFALVSLMSGNDYLPAVSGIKSAEKIWVRYLQLRHKRYPTQPLVDEWPVEEGLPPSHLEGGWAAALGDTGGAFVAEPYVHYTFCTQLLLELLGPGSGSPGEEAWPRQSNAAEGVKSYLQGLLWVLEMYHHGYCADFYFTFEKGKNSCANTSMIVKYLPELQAHGDEVLSPPRSESSPMRPITCAICILPAHNAEQFLCAAAPGLRPMFRSDHPLLGSVNAFESSVEIQECKSQLASLQAKMMHLREQGLDDTAIKAQLTEMNRKMDSLKKQTVDIDQLPLWEVDEEVQRRCAGLELSSIEFAQDITLVKDATAEAFELNPPVPRMGTVQCSGLLYYQGPWPAVAEATAQDEGEQCEEGATAEELAAAEEELERKGGWQTHTSNGGVNTSKDVDSEAVFDVEEEENQDEWYYGLGEPLPEVQEVQELEPPSKKRKRTGSLGEPVVAKPAGRADQNPVSILQITMDKAKVPLPTYTFSQTVSGWNCSCWATMSDGASCSVTGAGNNKAEAKRAAAQAILEYISPDVSKVCR